MERLDTADVLTRMERVERHCRGAEACVEVCHFFVLHFCSALFSPARGNSSQPTYVCSLKLISQRHFKAILGILSPESFMCLYALFSARVSGSRSCRQFGTIVIALIPPHIT
jgi:hypothetical protein